jgi:hypothetical protein
METSQVPAIKDAESERPIPSAWRPVIKEIVSAFVRHDYQLSNGIAGVTPVSTEAADQIRKSIQGYGAELVELPEAAWASSVCIWAGNHWDALIDLWSVSEGRSDLVLSLQVAEVGGSFEFSIYMVYVP